MLDRRKSHSASPVWRNDREIQMDAKSEECGAVKTWRPCLEIVHRTPLTKISARLNLTGWGEGGGGGEAES